MSNSAFDPSTFLDATTTEESLRRPPLPIGEYRAVIGELAPDTWVSRDGSKSGMKFNVPLTIDLPGDVQLSLGLNSATLTVKDSIMLELNEQGAIDYGLGKNGKLRMYREATGNNVKGKSFSPRALQGNVVTVNIGHRTNDAGDIFEDPKGVAAA